MSTDRTCTSEASARQTVTVHRSYTTFSLVAAWIGVLATAMMVGVVQAVSFNSHAYQMTALTVAVSGAAVSTSLAFFLTIYTILSKR
jgi:hypothetical protein